MITLDIEHPTVEEFFKVECKSNAKKFAESIAEYIENYKIKKSIKQGLAETKLMIDGKAKKRELEEILDEL